MCCNWPCNILNFHMYLFVRCSWGMVDECCCAFTEVTDVDKEELLRAALFTHGDDAAAISLCSIRWISASCWARCNFCWDSCRWCSSSLMWRCCSSSICSCSNGGILGNCFAASTAGLITGWAVGRNTISGGTVELTEAWTTWPLLLAGKNITGYMFGEAVSGEVGSCLHGILSTSIGTAEVLRDMAAFVLGSAVTILAGCFMNKMFASVLASLSEMPNVGVVVTEQGEESNWSDGLFSAAETCLFPLSISSTYGKRRSMRTGFKPDLAMLSRRHSSLRSVTFISSSRLRFAACTELTGATLGDGLAAMFTDVGCGDGVETASLAGAGFGGSFDGTERRNCMFFCWNSSCQRSSICCCCTRILNGVSAVAGLLLAQGSNCCWRFFGPKYWWNLKNFDLVPNFGRDFFETLLRLLDDDLAVAGVDVAYSKIHFNTFSELIILVSFCSCSTYLLIPAYRYISKIRLTLVQWPIYRRSHFLLGSH